MNKWIGTGRLTKDPDVRRTNEGKAVSRFDIACDRRFQKDTTDFFSCITFGKLAEFVEKYLTKGTKIIVTGELQNYNYTAKDGHKAYGMKIVLDEIEFAESKKSQETSEKKDADSDNFVNMPDEFIDQLPFK